VNTFQLAVSHAFPASADAGSQQSAKVSLTPTYSGTITASCDASAFSGQCSVTPGSPISITAGIATTLTLTVNIPNSAAPQPNNTYTVNLTVTDASGQPTQILPVALTVIQDFTLGALSPSTTQTITAGQSVSYNFNVLPVGSTFASAVGLACSGTPVISLILFTPGQVTPDNNSAAVVLKISTTPAGSASPPRHLPSLWLALPVLALLGTTARRKKRAKLALASSLLGLLLLALLLSSCGGGGSNGGGGGQQQGTQPGKYNITVTGASGSLSHTAPSTLTLVVN
jgi:hypothetical protein